MTFNLVAADAPKSKPKAAEDDVASPVKWTADLGASVPMTFSEEQNGLRLGMRIAKDADWQIGKEVQVELWVANSGSQDVNFESTARNDLGLRVFMTGVDGAEHAGSISIAWLPIILDEYHLQPEQAVRVREISVVFVPQDGPVDGRPQPKFTLPPGEYKLRCEHDLMETVILGPDGKQLDPKKDSWTGTLKSAAMDVTLAAADQE